MLDGLAIFENHSFRKKKWITGSILQSLHFSQDLRQYQITVACPQAVALEGKEKGS
jgi:hypothetical protein